MLPLLAWQLTDQHDHLAAFHLWKVLDLAMLFDVFCDALKQLTTKVLVRHLASAEAQGDLYLVAIGQKLEHIAHLDVIVTAVRIWAELDLFDLNDLLLLTGFGFTLLRFVLKLAKVHDFANRRIGIWRDFDQVEPCLVSHFHGTTRSNNSDVLAICADQADFVGADKFIDARAGVSLRRCVMGSASDDGRPLMVVLPNWEDKHPRRALQGENHATLRFGSAFSP